MRSIFFIFGLILALIAASFLPQAKDFRAEKSNAYFEQGNLKAAKRWYFLGKLQGDLEAANNYHVLSYQFTRYSENVSDKKKNANWRKSFRAFDKLTQKGSVSAAYNAGMFYYGSRPGTSDFANGLKYFDYAAASGDEISKHAADMMRARQYKDGEKNRALRKSADDGNAWAAYRYVRSYRLKKNQPRDLEKYALMGAEAGYADAQQYLGAYFPRRKDAKTWLETAATNPQNRSLTAAYDLSKLAEKEKDFAEERRWLRIGSKPRAKFKYPVIVKPDGLRWRGLQNTVAPDVNTSKNAAYELAIMQVDGVGGAVDLKAAKANLKYADEWSDAPQLLKQLQSGFKKLNRQTRRQSSNDRSAFDLVRYDSQKRFPFHGKLRSFMVNKQIRYATQKDFDKFKQGVSTRYNKEKWGFRKSGNVVRCALGSTCFYIEKPIIVPPDMFGANSVSFLVNPTITLPKQPSSHNQYIFMNERYIPK